MKKLLSALLALLLLSGLAAQPTLAAGLWYGHTSPLVGPHTGGNRVHVWTAMPQGLDRFQKIRDYTSGAVPGVPAGAWYEDEFQTLYECGLVEDSFSPKAGLSLAEVISLAVRLNCIYNGWDVPPEGMSYLEYAINTNIISAGQYSDYSAPVSRRDFATILANTFPSEALSGINAVPEGEILDVPTGDPGAKGIYVLYRAGVLVGDTQGYFRPDNAISRTSAVVAIARMIDPSLRQVATGFTAEATDITLDRTSLVMTPGASRNLTAHIYPVNAADQTVFWSSSEPRTVTVGPDGTVTAIRSGNALIIATTATGVYVSCSVKVMAIY